MMATLSRGGWGFSVPVAPTGSREKTKGWRKLKHGRALELEPYDLTATRNAPLGGAFTFYGHYQAGLERAAGEQALVDLS